MSSLYIFTKLPFAKTPKRFKEEAENIGFEARSLPYKKIHIEINNDSMKAYINNEELDPPDYAIIRSPGKNDRYLATQQGVVSWLLSKTTRVLNYRTISRFQTFDKLIQHIEFAKGGIPHVNSTIFMDLQLIVDSIEKYPVLVKSFTGSHGDKVKKVEKMSDILFFDKEDAPLIKQPFLTVGRDVRVIVIGDKAIGAMERIAQRGQYLTNFSAGGEVENFDLEKNEEVRQIAERAAKQLECDYAGVDLIQDGQGNWLVLEVNRYCEFEGFELSTGMNVARTAIEYLQHN